MGDVHREQHDEVLYDCIQPVSFKMQLKRGGCTAALLVRAPWLPLHSATLMECNLTCWAARLGALL